MSEDEAKDLHKEMSGRLQVLFDKDHIGHILIICKHLPTETPSDECLGVQTLTSAAIDIEMAKGILLRLMQNDIFEDALNFLLESKFVENLKDPLRDTKGSA